MTPSRAGASRRPASQLAATDEREPLGLIVQGSLSRGLEMRLASPVSVEELRVGQFVVVEGERQRFFSMLTDVALGLADPAILLDPPGPRSFATAALHGIGTFGSLTLTPMLMLARSAGAAPELRPVKTVPPHFSPVYAATETDFATVFGTEDDAERPHFALGTPLDMEVPVCVDLGRFVERSNGVFGKSGTGKSFLTRLLLAGVIRRGVAVNLIFDMHNEYGWEARAESAATPTVKGLQQLFGSEVVVFTLDPESTARRGIRGAHELKLGLSQLEVEDLALLAGELNLSEAAIESALILREALGDRRWLSRFLAMTPADIEAFVLAHKGHAGALKALQRKLVRVRELRYVVESAPTDGVAALLRHLEAGKHVVLEFGGLNSALSYMLAANVITRQIHAHYRRASEAYAADPLGRTPPRPLMITLEEAHKFLSPTVARQTIFGTIAREMRKYFVTLLIVDQRPGGIDAEVLSQVGTRITALLNDEADISAVFTGVSGGAHLRTVLAQLDPKQQALIMGYAVPMPVVVRTRAYDTAFYRAMTPGADDAEGGRHAAVERGKKHRDTLWPS